MDDIGGLKVRLRRFEDAQGELLYIHGLGESSRCFEELIQRQELRGWNHWAPDLPGYGDSPRPPQPLTLKEQADVLDGWMQQTGIRMAIVIGHSMGGVLGQIFCERFPDRVRGFINVEGNITLQDCTYSSQAVELDGIPSKLQDFLDFGFAKFKERIAKESHGNAALKGYLERLEFCDPGAFYLNSQELVELSKQEQMAVRLAQLQSRFPVLFVAGSPGGAAPESLQLLHKYNVPVKVIPSCGHWPFLDQPVVFLRIMRNFLSRI